MTQTETDRRHIAALVDHVVRADPRFDRDAARVIVLEVATRANVRTRLHNLFNDHPDVLTSGDPRIPQLVQRLIAALRQAGSAAVVPPECQACGRTKMLVHTLTDGRRVCRSCQGAASARPYDRCGKHRRTSNRSGHQLICGPCYARDPRSHKTCQSCGRLAAPAARTPSGVLCHRCAPRKVSDCGQCGQPRPAAAILLGGPICHPCYAVLRTTPRTCPTCQKPKILAFLDADSRHVCAGCAGQPTRFACAECGSEEHPHGRRCGRCVLDERLTAILSDATGEVNTALVPLHRMLLDTDEPLTTLTWIRRNHGLAILKRMAIGVVPITHQALDTVTPARHRNYLRDLLVSSGVLPAQDVDLERTMEWLAEFLTALPQGDKKILHPYVRWHTSPRLRSKSAQGRMTAHVAANTRTHLRGLAHFLAWLASRDAALDTARQQLVDAYLVDFPAGVRHLPQFFDWAHNRGMCGDLSSPSRRPGNSRTAIPDEQRWAAVERLLHDGDLPLDTRVIGLFVLLYGQPLSRISRMAIDQITDDGTLVTVRFAKDPIVMPPGVDELIRSLLGGRGKAAYDSRPTRWLFPGGNPGRPITARGLPTRLRSIGIQAGAGRNTALIHLAGEIPAAVLASLLGLNPNTAVEWSKIAGRDWSEYVSLRGGSRLRRDYR